MYEYRHVILPKEIAKKVPKGRLLTEHEWRSLGVQQSLGERACGCLLIEWRSCLSRFRLGAFHDP